MAGEHDIQYSFGQFARDGMGLFWRTLYTDQDFVESVVAGHAVAATQAAIDVDAAHAVRDHVRCPAHRRVHWSPLVVRLSGRNRAPGLRVGMDGGPRIGVQVDPVLYDDGSKFVVGRNMLNARTVLYRIEGTAPVSVATCLCDSVSRPTRTLVPGSDFTLADGVLAVREDRDPFSDGAYRIVDDGADRLAIVWACDALYAAGNVRQFLGYPLGLSFSETERARRLASTLWDALVHGLTSYYFNHVIGAVYDIPVTRGVERVESVGGGRVVTDAAVYAVADGHVAAGVETGASLAPGTFVSDHVRVITAPSDSDFVELVSSGALCSVTLPAGSVAGVDGGLVLHGADAYAYSAAFANMTFVLSDIGLPPDGDTLLAYDFLRALVPAQSGIQFIHCVSTTTSHGVAVTGALVPGVEPSTGARGVACACIASPLIVPNRPV